MKTSALMIFLGLLCSASSSQADDSVSPAPSSKPTKKQVPHGPKRPRTTPDMKKRILKNYPGQDQNLNPNPSKP